MACVPGSLQYHAGPGDAPAQTPGKPTHRDIPQISTDNWRAGAYLRLMVLRDVDEPQVAVGPQLSCRQAEPCNGTAPDRRMARRTANRQTDPSHTSLPQDTTGGPRLPDRPKSCASLGGLLHWRGAGITTEGSSREVVKGVRCEGSSRAALSCRPLSTPDDTFGGEKVDDPGPGARRRPPNAAGISAVGFPTANGASLPSDGPCPTEEWPSST